MIVATTGAELIEALHQSSLSVSVPRDASDLEESVALRSRVTVQDLSHTIDSDFGTGGRLEASRTVSIDPILDLDIGIRCDRKVFAVCAEIPDSNVQVRLGLNETADLTLEGSDELDFDEELPLAATDAGDDATLWISEVWTDREAHPAALGMPSVQDAMQRGRPLIAGMGDTVETEPVGGHGLNGHGLQGHEPSAGG